MKFPKGVYLKLAKSTCQLPSITTLCPVSYASILQRIVVNVILLCLPVCDWNS